MKQINRNNYEEYLIDLVDGKLLPSEESLLNSFLEENPDLKAEFDSFEPISILSDEKEYKNKKLLKKIGILSNLTTSNFDELCIAKLEGDLDKNELIKFDKFLEQKPKKKKEFNLYKLTKLSANPDTLFIDRDSLKRTLKEPKFTQRNYTAISIAASIILIFALYLLIPKQEELTFNNTTMSEAIVEEELNTIIEENINSQIKAVAEGSVIKTQKINERENLIKVKQELKLNESELNKTKTVTRDNISLAYMEPQEVSLDYNVANSKLVIVVTQNIAIEKEKYISPKSFLAGVFNKRVIGKQDNEKLELFDVMHAGVEGINKLLGSKMTLEKEYDENGNPDKTAFNSRLIAFSTPIKKN